MLLLLLLLVTRLWSCAGLELELCTVQGGEVGRGWA